GGEGGGRRLHAVHGDRFDAGHEAASGVEPRGASKHISSSETAEFLAFSSFTCHIEEHRVTPEYRLPRCHAVARGIAMRKMLTDRAIRALKLSPGERIEWWDTVIPAFGLRASATAKTFVLAHRFGGRNPVRLKLGRYPMISLERGREKAAQWIQMLEHGRDPRVELERERLAEARKRADTFSAVAQVFIEQKLRKERQGKDAERTLRRFIETWGSRPITDIDRRDIREVIDPVAIQAPYMAHSMLTIIKRFFAWCVDHDIIEFSPCATMKAAKIIGKRKPRQRVLGEDEIIALHQAASEMPYPHGPLLLMLLYTGQRHSDVAL